MKQKNAIHQCSCLSCKTKPLSQEAKLHKQINYMMSILDEKQRRIYAAHQAEQLGANGDQYIVEITGISLQTLIKGRRELYEEVDIESVREVGGGREPIDRKDPEFLKN